MLYNGNAEAFKKFREISVLDIQPLRIGQVEDTEAATGMTVLISDEGMRAGLDVRGGGPASRDSQMLNPLMSMQKIVHVNSAKKVEIKFVHRVETIDYINAYFDRHFIQTLDLDFTVETHDERNIYTNTYTLHLPPEVKFTDLVNDLSEHPNVMSIRTTHA